MGPLAIYPVRTKKTYWIKSGLVAALSVLALVFLVPKIFDQEFESFLWLYAGLSVLFVLFPAAFWLSTSGQRVGDEGEIVLYRDMLLIPSSVGQTRLPLAGLDMQQSSSSVGMSFSGIPVGSMEIGRCLRFRTAGTRRDVDRSVFTDPDHFRQLIEDVQVVIAGGSPSGSAAYLADRSHPEQGTV